MLQKFYLERAVAAIDFSLESFVPVLEGSLVK